MIDQNQKPKAKPWVDFIPEFKPKKHESRDDIINEFCATTEEILKMKELFKLAVIDQKNIHDAYYRMWVNDSNKLFRLAVQFKKRMSRKP